MVAYLAYLDMFQSWPVRIYFAWLPLDDSWESCII